jgi:hypothetical protein
MTTTLNVVISHACSGSRVKQTHHISQVPELTPEVDGRLHEALLPFHKVESIARRGGVRVLVVVQGRNELELCVPAEQLKDAVRLLNRR